MAAAMGAAAGTTAGDSVVTHPETTDGVCIILWQVQTDWVDNWHDYNAEWCNKLETAYNSQTEICERPVKEVIFKYRPHEFIQENMETNKRRALRRVIQQKNVAQWLHSSHLPEVEKYNKSKHDTSAANARSRPRAPLRARSSSAPRQRW